MKLKKRSDNEPSEPMEEAVPKGKKPVVVYIMVLFIAAFLLMAWSFASHQRSSSEALGQLQSSVGTMQEVQGLQDQVISLQKELVEARNAAAAFQDANETSRNQASLLEHNLEQTREAMDWFWQLDEAFLAGDMEMSRTILAKMEENTETPMSEYLTDLSADRYQEIKKSVESTAAGH